MMLNFTSRRYSKVFRPMSICPLFCSSVSFFERVTIGGNISGNFTCDGIYNYFVGSCSIFCLGQFEGWYNRFKMSPTVGLRGIHFPNSIETGSVYPSSTKVLHRVLSMVKRVVKNAFQVNGTFNFSRRRCAYRYGSFFPNIPIFTVYFRLDRGLRVIWAGP